jgi:GH25 family lysozyme M1 (1,4-beta-N-acetylmuramidase)
MRSFKVGFHLGPGGDPRGIGEMWREFDAAGIPIFVKSADAYGPCFEVLGLPNAHLHTAVYRMSTTGQPSGFDYDVPLYKQLPNDPIGAAQIHWTETLNALPPEFDDRCWIEPINEVDKAEAAWLGEFACEIGRLALRDGKKVTLFGWSSGEPEPYHWEEPSMLRFLGMCAANPNRIAVSVHEYSYEVEDPGDLNPLDNGYPFKFGRFMYLFAVCDKFNIPRPTVHITEGGWTLWETPPAEAAEDDLLWADALYHDYPEIKGTAIWYLGAGWNNINRKANQLIPLVKRLGLNTPERPVPAKKELPVLPVTPQMMGWKQYADEPEPDKPEPDKGDKVKVTKQVPSHHVAGMRGFETGTPVYLKMNVIYNDGASNVTSPWMDIPVDFSEWEDIRGFEFISRVKTNIEFEIECPSGSAQKPKPDPEPDPEPDPDPVPPPSGEYPVLVTDISHWQGSIDMDKLCSQGVQAIMMKATEATGHVDSRVRTYYQDAMNAGYQKELVTFYHFYRFAADPVEQAEHFCETVKSVAGGFYTALVADVEDTSVSAWGKGDELKLFLDTVEYLSGFRPMIYTASWWWNPARWERQGWAGRYALIEAEYSLDPQDGNNINVDYVTKQLQGRDPVISTDFQDWHFWQFTSKARGRDFGAQSANIDMQFLNSEKYSLDFLFTLKGSVSQDPRPSPSPQPGAVDLLDYLRAPNGIMTDNDAKVFTQSYQYGWITDDTWVLIKGSDGKGTVEQYFYDNDYIYRTYDTSEDSTRGWWYAQFKDGHLGAPWIKRHMSIGESFTMSKQVEHYVWPCNVRIPMADVVDTIAFTAHYAEFTLPSGKVMHDVVELHWAQGGETYWFAKGRGLVGFKNEFYASGWTGDLHGREDMTWNIPPCMPH